MLIIGLAAQAPRRLRPLSSNVRPQNPSATRCSNMPLHKPANLVRLLLLWIFVAFLAGCATDSKVISPAPAWSGERPVDRLSLYVFVDMRPEYMPPAFRTAVETGLNQALEDARIPHTQSWFLDSTAGQRLLADPKSRTLGNTTFVSIGKTIEENRSAESSLVPTHRLIAFPKDTLKSGAGAILDVRWDIYDVRTGNLEWSVFTRTPVISRDMDPVAAKSAGDSLVRAIITELKSRAVLH